ncbi:MAG: glycosyltransferase family 2 protein [Gammaproteobacteria bacterium]|nr:glycosyltransferase family 2 protein [Gammaproteobacteria bacterium]
MGITNRRLNQAKVLDAVSAVGQQAKNDSQINNDNAAQKTLNASWPPSPKCIGNIECLDNGLVIGWIATVENGQFHGGVSIYIDGQFAGEVGELLYRPDLDEAGIAGGFAMFKVNCSHCINDESREYSVAAVQTSSGKQVLLLEAVLMGYCHTPLNPKISLSLSSPSQIDGWQYQCKPETGLHLEQYSAPQQIADKARSYLRFSCTESFDIPEVLNFSSSIDIPEHVILDNLEIGFLIRSDRHTPLCISLLKNGEVISELQTYADNSWVPRNHRLENTKGLLAKTGDQFSLQLSVTHQGHSFFDVAYVCVAEHVSSELLADLLIDEPDMGSLQEDTANKEINYISNGNLATWSHGLVLGDLKASTPMADGWKIYCSEEQQAQVNLCVNVYEVHSKGSSDQPDQLLGIRLRTKDLLNPIRLETDVLMSFLEKDTLELSIDIASLEPEKTSKITRIVLLAKGMDRECLLHVVAKQVRIRGNDTLRFSLNEGDMVKIRRGCAGFPSIKLGIDIGPNTEVLFKTISLTKELKSQRANQPVSTSAEFNQFEDEAVSSQISLVKGLEYWSQEDIVTPEQGYLVDQKRIAKIASGLNATTMSLPKIERPEVAYPSVDIVVPIYNALDSVIECIRSVFEKTTIPFTLILVDDCSAPETEKFLCEIDAQYQNVINIRNQKNLGYTKSVNAGLTRTTSDIVCILNSDCIVTDMWIQKLIDCVRSSDDIGIVGPLSNAASYQSVPRIHTKPGDWSFNPLPCSMPPQELADLISEVSVRSYPSAGVINGFCQLITRAVIDQIGFLDEESFPRGFGEENDYCARAKKAGFNIVVADDTYVYHTKSQSFGHEERERLSQLGAQALQAKHADVDWNQVVQDLEQAPGLMELRRKLISLGH